ELAWNRVCPSGGAFLTAAAPIAPPPPGRDSTTMAWPVFSVTFLPTMRCSVSALAPGVNGMTMVIGRDDNSSAAVGVAASALASVAASTTDDLTIASSHCAPPLGPVSFGMKLSVEHTAVAAT